MALGSEFRTKDLYIVEKPVAAALGEGIDVMHTPGTLIVDFGADTVEISVLAQGGVVASRLLKIGGNTMDEVICESVKEKCSLLIGMKTAEALKLELGSALNTVSSHKNILGRDRLPGCLQRQPFLQKLSANRFRNFSGRLFIKSTVFLSIRRRKSSGLYKITVSSLPARAVVSQISSYIWAGTEYSRDHV